MFSAFKTFAAAAAEKVTEGVTIATASAKHYIEQEAEKFREEERHTEELKEEERKKPKESWPLWEVDREEHSILQGELKKQILELSLSVDTFEWPVPGAYTFEYERLVPFTLNMMRIDENFPVAHRKFVPRKMTEEEFLRRYFFHVDEVRQNIGVCPLLECHRLQDENEMTEIESKKQADRIIANSIDLEMTQIDADLEIPAELQQELAEVVEEFDAAHSQDNKNSENDTEEQSASTEIDESLLEVLLGDDLVNGSTDDIVVSASASTAPSGPKNADEETSETVTDTFEGVSPSNKLTSGSDTNNEFSEMELINFEDLDLDPDAMLEGISLADKLAADEFDLELN